MDSIRGRIGLVPNTPFIVSMFGTLSDALMGANSEWENYIPNNILKNTNGIYHASTMFISNNVRNCMSIGYVKKFTFEDFEDLLTPECAALSYSPVYKENGDKKDSHVNPCKNYLSEYTGIITDAVYFYATGDVDIILKLLSEIKFIGKKKTAQIQMKENGQPDIEFDIVSGDFVGIVDKHGMAVRPIPVEMGAQFNVNPTKSSRRIMSWKPNYRTSEKTDCYNVIGNTFMLPKKRIFDMYDDVE